MLDQPCVIDRFVDGSRADRIAPHSDAAKVKVFCTELQARVVDRCLQLHRGYGYVREYPIARMYADARVSRIYGGTTEVLETMIAKSLGL